MKHLYLLLSIGLLYSPVNAGYFTTSTDGEQTYVVEEVCFSPEGKCSQLILDYLNGATESLDIALYSLTHPEITQVIINAHNRGIKVRLIIDKTQAEIKDATDDQLEQAGIPVKRMRSLKSGLMHHKFAVLDGVLLFTGSYNWTRGGDHKNAENLNLLSAEELVKKYQAEFNKLWNAPAPRPRTGGKDETLKTH